jgi:hypothetical protein
LNNQSSYRLICICGGILFFGVSSAHADVQSNAVNFHKKNANCVDVRLSLVPPILLQRITPSKLDFGLFIDQLLRMPEKDFDLKVNKVQKMIEKNTHLISSMWGPLKVKWTWVASEEWKKSVSEQSLVLTLPVKMQGHPSSVTIMAEACSAKPLGRLQIGFYPALYPLLVDVDNRDHQWLTEELPQSTIDFLN